MEAKTIRFSKHSWAAGGLIFLVLAAGITAAPRPAQEAYGRSPASLETAKAPAVAARRTKRMEIHKDGVIIVPSQHKARDGAMEDNRNFLYLTGLKEPDAVLVLDPAGSPRETLFRRAAGGPGALGASGGGMVSPGGAEAPMVAVAPRGQAPAQEAAAPDKGLVEKPNSQLASALFGATMAGRAKRVLLPFSDFDFLSRAFPAFNPVAQSEAVLNVDPYIAEMRLTKDADESAALREAVDLTAEAMREAFRAAGPGLTEVDLVRRALNLACGSSLPWK